ncbi:MAG: tetratricopeptide repeat protein [Deltaproteobacteria bacterium]|nr:tetratricopeptide repeat protein [Deltaproteobacteria bacterium]
MKPQNRQRIVGLALVFAFIFSGCAADKAFRERQSRGARDLGERFLARNDTSKALEQFLKAEEIYPDDPYLHYDLALTYDMKGVLDKAEYHLKQAIKLKPDYSDAYNYLGFVYFRQGRVQEAIEAYNTALDNLLYQNPQEAQLNLGVAYLSLKDYQKAKVHLEEAIKIVPTFVAAYNTLGKAYEGLRQYDKARRAYEQAMELNPESVEAYLNLGKLLYKSGERQKAINCFDKVIRLDPGSDRAEEALRYLRALRK